MVKRGQRSVVKRQKEIKRKQKALEKMARRQNKKKDTAGAGEEQTADPPEEQE